MRKFVGYTFFGLGLLISWGLYFGLIALTIYYIVTIFIDEGVVVGIISIPIAGICLTIIYFIISLLMMPLVLLVAALFGVHRE